MTLSVQEILIRMIRSLDLFAQLDDDECLELSKDFTLQYYPQNSRIIQEWTRPQKIYILKRWLLKAKKSVNWTEKLLWEILPGQIFGEMSYLLQQNAVANVYCDQESDVWELSIAHFDQFLKNHPAVLTQIKEIIVQRRTKNDSILWNY